MRGVAIANVLCVATAFHLSPASAGRSRVALSGLLKGLDPILTADLLHVLRSAGHGDVIAVVDVNFPAVECSAN